MSKEDLLLLKIALKPGIFGDIEDSLALGYTYKQIAAVLGITRAELLSWINRGAREIEGPYHDLFRAIERGEAKAEAYYIDAIRDAAVNDWRAAESYLKRRHREDWGDKVSSEVSNGAGGPVQIEVSYIDKVIDPRKAEEEEKYENAIETSVEQVEIDPVKEHRQLTAGSLDE